MKSPRSEFDGRARTYESGRLGAWYKAQAELVIERARLRSGASVLDVGCATGWLLRQLGQRYSGVTGLGVDLSPRMVELARERARVAGVLNLSFVAADWEEIDPRLLLEGNDLRTADLVTCVSVLHYFQDPQAALTRMHTATSAGGRLLLLDRARDRSLMTWVWDLIHRAILRDTTAFYRTEELIDLVVRAGFQQPRVSESVRRIFWKGKLSTSLALISANR